MSGAHCAAALLVAGLACAAQPAAAQNRAAAVVHDVAPALFRALSSGRGVDRAAALRNALRALLAPGAPAWDADCEADRLATGGAPGVIRHALADGSWLIEVGCAAGAYQGSFWAAWLWRDAAPPARAPAGQATLIVWPVAVERSTAGAAAATTPPVVPASAPAAAPGIELVDEVVAWGEVRALAAGRAAAPAEVEIANRFRASGDCGTRSRYALREGRAELVALAAAFVCPDTVQPGAAWPSVTLPVR